MSSVRPCSAQKTEIDAARTDLPVPPFPLATHKEAARTPPIVHAPVALVARARGDSSYEALSRLNSRRAWFQFKGLGRENLAGARQRADFGLE